MTAGVYLHVPFCKSRCSYCDFATDVYQNGETVERYVSALIKEIESFSQNGAAVDTIYFGGGTPSLLSAAQIEKILNSVYKNFSVTKGVELTMEMNPATVSLETLKGYRTLGVNRASFGAQTFDDAELKRLGRRHTGRDVRQTIELLREAGFRNVSFDLIAGLPRQTIRDWVRNLNEALKLKPEHLSLYLLEIHEGTPLAAQIESRRQPTPDEDLAGEMYEIMLEKVVASGYEQYEISNFCQPGFESKHNSKYWLCEAVYAFGVSAHSFDGEKRRWSNERDTNLYVQSIESEKSTIVEVNNLSPKQLAAEFAFLKLRLTKGLNLTEYETRFGINLLSEYSEDFARLKDWDLITVDENNLKLTRRGMVYSNEVFAVFV